MATGFRQKTPSKHADTARAASSVPPAREVPAVDGKQQADLFDRAIKLFQTGSYAEAVPLFEKAAAGPGLEMAHSARAHAGMCVRRTDAREPSLRTPDEHYDYAIALLNERRLPQAERHLVEAIAQAPKADYIHYALALCRGLEGDLQSAYRHLRRAIEIQPKNRIIARNDPDFADISRLSPLSELLYPERTVAAQTRR
jgi:tetratricopeptide (TPR) repeat protein